MNKGYLARYLLLGIGFLYFTLSFAHRFYGSMSSAADDAFIAQLLESIAQGGGPISNVANTVAFYFDNFLGKTSDFICSTNGLYGTQLPNFNYFEWHTYLILYLFAPISILIGSKLTLASASVASLVGLFCYTYLFSKRFNNSSWPYIITVLIFLSLPHLKGLIFGQFYIDRLFIGLLPAYLYHATSVNKSNWDYVIETALGLTIVSLSERFAAVLIVIVVYLLFSGLVKPRTRQQWAFYGALLSITCSYVFYIYRNVINYAPNDSFKSSILYSLVNLHSIFLDPSFIMLSFMVINILQFLPLALFGNSSRWFLLSFILMAPNILGDVGGAEKQGYYTHYHSVYFPVLAIAIAVSIAKIMSLRSRNTYVAYALILCLMNSFVSIEFTGDIRQPIISTILRLTSPSEETGLHAILSHLSVKTSVDNNLLISIPSRLSSARDAAVTRQSIKTELKSLDVPVGSSISTSEDMFVTLAGSYKLHYFPSGIDQSDYIIADSIISSDGELRLNGAISYHGPEDALKMNNCATKIAKQAGFNLRDYKRLSNGYYLIRNASRPTGGNGSRSGAIL